MAPRSAEPATTSSTLSSTLSVRTLLPAPVPAVLAASLDLDVELAAVGRYGVHARSGGAGSRSSGRIGLDETVTWQLGPGRGGVPLHTSRIVELVEDDGCGGARFVDAMDVGLFEAFRHEHLLTPARQGIGGTVLHDLVRWRSPLGAAGRAADVLFVRRVLRALLVSRNAEIARAVAPAWAAPPREQLSN